MWYFLQANTFQVVIASDASSSYVFLLYADHGVQWIQSKGKGSRPDARAQAGIMAHDGRMHALRGSGTDQVQNLDKSVFFTILLRNFRKNSKIAFFVYNVNLCC